MILDDVLPILEWEFPAPPSGSNFSILRNCKWADSKLNFGGPFFPKYFEIMSPQLQSITNPLKPVTKKYLWIFLFKQMSLMFSLNCATLKVLLKNQSSLAESLNGGHTRPEMPLSNTLKKTRRLVGITSKQLTSMRGGHQKPWKPDVLVCRCLSAWFNVLHSMLSLL